MAFYSLLFMGTKEELDKILAGNKIGTLHNFGEVGPRRSQEQEDEKGKRKGGNVNIRFNVDKGDNKKIVANPFEFAQKIKKVDTSRPGHRIETEEIKTVRITPPASWYLYLGEVLPKSEAEAQTGFIAMEEAITFAKKV